MLFYIYFFTSTLSVDGQILGDRIGRYFDINGEIIEDYYDVDYEPKKSFEYTHNIGVNFSPGRFYSSTGKKTEGYIKYLQNTVDFKFRASLNEKAITIRATQCLGFAIGVDSFATINYNDIVGKEKMSFKSNLLFAEVLEQVGGFSFYKQYNIDGAGAGAALYYVKENGSTKYQIFPTKKEEFKEMAIKIFGSNLVIAKKIASGEYSQNEFINVLKLFKYKHYSDRGKKLFFNSSLNEIGDSSTSTYYGKIDAIGDSLYRIAYYYLNDVKVFEGNYTSFIPKIKDGEFTYYYPDGVESKRLFFKNNKVTRSITYYRTSSQHREFRIIDDIKKYVSVRDRNGNELLDYNGEGKEIVFDSLNNREIIYQYSKNKLVSAYFTDGTQKKIYQYFQDNIKVKPLADLQVSFQEKTQYPLEAIKNNKFGVLLLKCNVDPLGKISNIKIVKGIDPAIDNMAFSLIPYLNANSVFEIGEINRENVYQEVLFPIEFSIIGFTRTSLSNSKFWQQAGIAVLRQTLLRIH